MNKWKQRYIDLYKKAHLYMRGELGDICHFCLNDYTKICNENCPYKCSGNELEDENGNTVNYNWTCYDFEFAECAALENTICNECSHSENNCGFELNNELLEKFYKKGHT